ncbi:MAG: DNRLRE domain-containing protein [Promethearchaeota archaeon]
MRERVFIIIILIISFLGCFSISSTPLVEHSVISDCTFDSYVISSDPDINYGNSSDLKVTYNSSPLTWHFTFLAFRVNSLPFPCEVLGVKLSINITSLIPLNQSFDIWVWETSSFNEESITWENKPNSREETLVSVGTITQLGWYECTLSAVHHVRENGYYYFKIEPLISSQGSITIASEENGYYWSSRLEISYEEVSFESYQYSVSSDDFTFITLGLIGIFALGTLLLFSLISIVSILLVRSQRSQSRRSTVLYEPRLRHKSAEKMDEVGYCSVCGERISPREIFCTNCGTRNI